MRYLIIGGTGSLGKATIKALYRQNPQSDITVMSRDELKQKNLLAKYSSLKFAIGDVRDERSVLSVIDGYDTVFHFAAMKHVDTCEQNLYECHQINLQGTINVVNAIIKSKPQYAVFCSTDKAVLPINAYGYCKAFSEKYWLSKNSADKTIFSAFRWGNICHSRGSVLHLFADTLKNHKMVNITDQRMTRFWTHIDDVVEFMLAGYKSGHPEIMIPEMKAASVIRMAEAVAHVIGVKEYKVNIKGIRDGEKLHECLYTSHTRCLNSDDAPQFEFDELCNLVARGLESGS